MSTAAVILWNHRWEYDKNPDVFFEALFRIKDDGIDYKLIVLGEAFSKYPKIFDEAKEKLNQHLSHFGYVENKKEYIEWMKLADIVPVTSIQDFFGESLVQAMYYDCYPLVPNRLVFPEHFPVEDRSKFVYNSDKELYDRLKKLIQEIEETRKTTTRHYVEKYSWLNIIEKYDKEFDDLAKS